MLLTDSDFVVPVDGLEGVSSDFSFDVVTTFDEVAFLLAVSVLSSQLFSVIDSFSVFVVPVDAISGILSNVLFEVDSLFGLLVPFSEVFGTSFNVGVSSIFDDPVTVETSETDVLLGVGFSEDVVILPDTDAVVSNVVV